MKTKLIITFILFFSLIPFFIQENEKTGISQKEENKKFNQFKENMAIVKHIKKINEIAFILASTKIQFNLNDDDVLPFFYYKINNYRKYIVHLFLNQAYILNQKEKKQYITNKSDSDTLYLSVMNSIIYQDDYCIIAKQDKVKLFSNFISVKDCKQGQLVLSINTKNYKNN